MEFHDEIKLQRPLEPGFGVLAHVTSLPGDGTGRPGTFDAARAFVDGLATAGVRYWQVLPLNPVDRHGSPYAGVSAFAGNADLLGSSALDGNRGFDEGAYREFRARAAGWLEPYACFMACRRRFGAAWQDWPDPYRRFDPQVVAADGGLAGAAEACRRGQFAFDRQWRAVRAYANERGVRVIGDIPIYVGAGSADAWERPGLFQLDGRGRPRQIAGCPPDGFAPDGQVWNNPVYDWDAHARDGFAWWVRRLRRALELYDVVRLDHFIGFERYYSIPAGAPASAGSFRQGPGIGLFRAAFDELGPLPVIAEDLGLVTPEVQALVDGCGFPGMDVLQFADGDPLEGYRPRPGTVAYAGTHDNQTLLGFACGRYPGRDGAELAGRLMRAVAASDAPVRIVPLQDLMGLGDEARMNVPGTVGGNWSWRADAAGMDAAFARARGLVALSR